MIAVSLRLSALATILTLYKSTGFNIERAGLSWLAAFDQGGKMMHEQKERIEDLMSSLKQLRDELKVQIHLGKI